MITTKRLELRPHCPEHLLALIEGNDQYERHAGLKPAAGLREFYISGDISQEFLAQLRNGAEPNPWEFGFAVVLREAGLVIGSAGFKGPAGSEGIVEIAYGIVPAYQGRGFATEAADSLVSFASQFKDVQKLRAHTLPETNASTRVLEKCGFHFVGQVIDPDDGLLWRWERTPTIVRSN